MWKRFRGKEDKNYNYIPALNITIVNSFDNKPYIFDKRVIVVCEIVFVLGILSLFCPPLGNTSIGSPFERSSYTEQYYVYIRENSKQAISYKVKADIQNIDYNYFIKKIYWNNGGYLSFTDYYNTIYPGEESKCYAIKDDKYYILLTKEKVE